MQKISNLFHKLKTKKAIAKLSLFTFAFITIAQLCIPLSVHATESDIELTSSNPRVKTLYVTRTAIINNKKWFQSCHGTVLGKGKFIKRSYLYNTETSDGELHYNPTVVVFSNKPFSHSVHSLLYIDGVLNSESSVDSLDATEYNGIYWASFGISTSAIDELISTTGFSNFINVSHLSRGFVEQVESDIDNGLINFETESDFEDYYDSGRAELDTSIGYLQNVIYKEVSSSALNGNLSRNGVFTWSTSNDKYNDCQIEIRAYNFYVKFVNNATYENWTYKQYGDNVMYSDGTLTFSALEPSLQWLGYKGINPTEKIDTQSYGTKTYYLRLVRYDSDNNKFRYGGWTKVDLTSNSSSQVPTTGVQTGILDETTGEWIQDTDSDTSYEYKTDGKGNLTGNIDVNSWDDLNLNSFTWLYRNLKAMIDGLGEFPTMVSTVFGFLPPQLITALSMFLVALVILRFLGR